MEPVIGFGVDQGDPHRDDMNRYFLARQSRRTWGKPELIFTLKCLIRKGLQMSSGNVQPPNKSRPVLPLLVLHIAAAGVCFAFFSIAPVAVCLVCMAIGNDPGGPMFFPIFVMGTILGAAVITALLGGAALLSDLIRRHYRMPLWLPPVAVFAFTTALCWFLFRNAQPAVPPLVGVLVATALLRIGWRIKRQTGGSQSNLGPRGLARFHLRISRRC